MPGLRYRSSAAVSPHTHTHRRPTDPTHLPLPRSQYREKIYSFLLLMRACEPDWLSLSRTLSLSLSHSHCLFLLLFLPLLLRLLLFLRRAEKTLSLLTGTELKKLIPRKQCFRTASQIYLLQDESPVEENRDFSLFSSASFPTRRPSSFQFYFHYLFIVINNPGLRGRCKKCA
jgi:hypothetical protein